ncbi:MAG: polyphosphate kinase 1 [Gammaproteobacteria bacterium]
MNTINLKNPDLYNNRELSLLAFNRRVLAMAEDQEVPLLERLQFMTITSANLDEFFEIRIAGLKHQVAFASVQTGPDNLSPIDQLKRVSESAHQLIEDQYNILNNHLIPDLEDAGVHFLRRDDWDEKTATWVRRYFTHDVLPVVSPIGLDPAHPFPRILNKSLNFIVSLEGKDAFGRNSGIAIVQAPRSLPRLLQIPEEVSGRPYDFVFLSSIIHEHVSDLFPGMQVKGCYQFRVTRNGDLFVDDEEVDDLLRALEGQLPSRRFSEAMRLEVADNCPQEIAQFLLDQFKLTTEDLYQVNGPVNLKRLMHLYDLVDIPTLKYAGFIPGIPKKLTLGTDNFEAIQQGDILLNHPFESFAPVLEFIRQAASDPNVLSIKQTLYRTGAESAVVNALVEAARAGKEVTVVIELRARFDEEANIELANKLQEAGAHVVYGVVGHKTHAKMLLVVRREGRSLRRYVHLGTGNYHASTARVYTDYGLFTCDPDFAEDAHKIFHQLTAPGKPGKLKKLLQSPFTLHKSMLKYITQEISHAQAGRPAKIIAKMNALTDREIIRMLYTASQAGVKIQLIIRGVCLLKPGVEGVSENISVRSIIGRFLEHQRIYYFLNDGDSHLYCSSADWMERNFFRRVETCFPIVDQKLHQRVLKQGLMLYLSDNTQAWALQADGSYERIVPKKLEPKSAQEILLEALGD